MASARFLKQQLFLPLLVLIVGLAATVVLFLRAQAWVEETLDEELRHEAGQLAARMQQQFALQEETLRGLAGLFVTSDEVTRRDFRAYVARLDLAERFPAAVEYRYARHLRAQELPGWQRQVAASLAEVGEKPFQPAPKPAGERAEYLLVEYVYPFNPAALGLDLLPGPRRKAIAQLEARAELALSERLANEYPQAPHYSLMARLPGKSEEILPGTVALIFRPDRLIQTIAASSDAGLDLELYDRPATAPLGGAIPPVFDTHAEEDAPHAAQHLPLQARLPIKVADAEWTLVVTALPNWEPAVQDRWFPIAVGAAGVVLTLLLALAARLLLLRWQSAEANLQMSRDDLLRAQAVAKIGSWHLDGPSGHLFWSPQTFRIFGLPEGTPLDYPRFLACVHPEDRGLVDAAWQAALKGAPYCIEHRIVVDGVTQWVEERAELLFDENGKFLAAHGTVRDITAQKEAEEALRRLNAELEQRVVERTRQLEELLVQRQDFLATMSHEIRTPLTGLLGMLELLSLSPLPDEERHQLAIARESGKALSRIIDDILDYSKIGAGRLTLSPEPEDLPALIDGVRDAHLATASAKGISLMSFVDPRLPRALVMDGLRVRQILQNFVSNALKFTAEGYVELRADWLGQQDGQVTLKLSVRDTGIGIAPEVQKQLFERYSQADHTVARRYGGTGLGLAICKRLAELMGGEIGVESAPARGSSFFVTLTLPVAETAPPPPATASVALRQLDGGGRPVLVADDHPTNRALIARQLALLGLPVELAENGNQALAKWKHGDYCLIVTDVHMPVMDGFELAQAVREIERQEGRKPTPIIAWTAAAMGEEVARCRAAGMDDVLVKPTELVTLRTVLARWLPFAADNGAPIPIDPGMVLDRAVLGQLAEGAEEERLILADFVNQTRRDLAELEAALARDDAAAATREAHRIKGAAKMVGALRLAARAARAEEAARRHDLAQAAERLREIEADLAELEASAGLAAPPAAEPANPDAPPVFDPAVLADMVGDSQKLQHELIDSFFVHADAPLAEIRAAYERRAARDLARAAHKLKSSARAIGAQELAALLAALEAAGNNIDWEAAARGYHQLDEAWARLVARLQGAHE
ncbi:ATP-binding protein [Sulfuricystis multivorans]|uniref:ATP-binding protein n=1 Tax=Sulfuricystis multivorans TaxID=2211108 RepID=UPI000F83D48B|nr:ATP-binding protein [Sulfuricystis multivorans]